MKLDVSQVNVAPGKATGLIYDPNKLFISSTLRQPAALPAPAPHNQLTQVPMSQSTPNSSASVKLPKRILDQFSGDPLEWPEWSGQFLATIDQPLADDGMKTNYLKALVTGKIKEAIEGMGYNAGTYRIAWDILARDFGRPELVVNAQLKRLHSYLFIKPHDTAEVIKYSHIVSSCVNVLSQYGPESGLTSESILNNAVRKSPIEMKAKWLTYLQS